MTPTLSLDTSKKLVELGMKLETEKWWRLKNFSSGASPSYELVLEGYIKDRNKIPAPSSDELLEVMKDIQGFTLPYWSSSEHDWIENRDVSRIHSKTFCEALGKQALAYLKNGYHYDKEKGGLGR